MSTVAVPSPLIVAPLPGVTVSVPVPAGRLSVVLRLALSTSATDRPVIASAVSSGVFWAPGSVLAGASLVPRMVIVTFCWSLPPCPSATVTVKIAVTVSPVARKSRLASVMA